MALVTCREPDYTVDLDFDRVVIMPLDPLRIRDFLRRRMRLPANTTRISSKKSADSMRTSSGSRPICRLI